MTPITYAYIGFIAGCVVGILMHFPREKSQIVHQWGQYKPGQKAYIINHNGDIEEVTLETIFIGNHHFSMSYKRKGEWRSYDTDGIKVKLFRSYEEALTMIQNKHCGVK